jgi:hypothetical protein
MGGTGERREEWWRVVGGVAERAGEWRGEWWDVEWWSLREF